VPRPDLLIVARGGGSLEDLWGFNEEIVVRAAAESRIPLISAVGHETDTTLIDFAADRRAPTPSAAAEMAVPVRLELLAGLARLEERRRAAAARGMAQRGQRLRDLARGLPRPEALMAERAQRLDGLSLRLPRALTAYARDRRLGLSGGAAGRFGAGLLAIGVERRRQRVLRAGLGLRPEAMRRAVARLRERLAMRGGRLEQVERRLTRGAGAALADGPAGRFGPGLLAAGLDGRRQRLLGAGAGVRADAMRRAVADRRERLAVRGARLERVEERLTRDARAALDGLGRTLATLGPQAVLARGYAVVRDAGGAVVTGAAAARGAAGLELEFADGRVRVRPERAAAPRRRDPGEDQGRLI
jgi:exodeoxyribonuclease VII large subunit